jgi:hypothetical protein
MVYLKCLFGNLFKGFKEGVLPIFILLMVSIVLMTIPALFGFILALFYHLSFEPMIATSFYYYASLTTDILISLILLAVIVVYPYIVIRQTIIGIYNWIKISYREARAKCAINYMDELFNRKK